MYYSVTIDDVRCLTLMNQYGVVLDKKYPCTFGPLLATRDCSHFIMYDERLFITFSVKDSKLETKTSGGYASAIGKDYAMLQRFGNEGNNTCLNFNTMDKQPIPEHLIGFASKEPAGGCQNKDGTTMMIEKDNVELITKEGSKRLMKSGDYVTHYVNEADGKYYIFKRSSIFRWTETDGLEQIIKGVRSGVYAKSVSFNEEYKKLAVAWLTRENIYCINTSDGMFSFPVPHMVSHVCSFYLPNWNILSLLFLWRFKEKNSITRPEALPLDVFKIICKMVIKFS